jgi:hypothetical protein
MNKIHEMKINFSILIIVLTLLIGLKKTSNAQVWSKSFTAGNVD